MNKKGQSEAQKRVNRYFPMPPIAYQPGLSIVFGSVNVGILLSQLLYWTGRQSSKDGWIYKTISELKHETGLTRYQQATAIDICKQSGILEMKLAGIPAKRHFRVNRQLLENQLPGLMKNAKLVYLPAPLQSAGNQQTNTEITHKTTSKNTQIINKTFQRSRGSPTLHISEVIDMKSFNKIRDEKEDVG